ncbi:MAG: hypothetical protein ACREDT_12820 [Methylocella sp.]
MKALWLPLGAAVMFAQPAAAAHLTKQEKFNQPAQQNNINQSPPSQPSQSPAQQMRDSLQRSGFSAVQVMPEAFLIRAKDPQGNPVEMIIRPDSFAAVDVTRENGNLTTGRSVGPVPSAKFAQGPVQDAMSSNLEGTPVQSSDAQDVGKIKGIAIGNDGSLSYLVTLKGGRDVAVEPTAMSMSFNEATDKWNATVDATDQQVASAPRIQYRQQ